jgi:hypothetical protein
MTMLGDTSLLLLGAGWSWATLLLMAYWAVMLHISSVVSLMVLADA